jgi:hypothetical protein
MGRPTATLGDPVADLALREGVPVYDRRGRRIGVLDRAMRDEATEIFEGIVIHTLPLPGRHLYAGHDQIAELRERGVVLSVDAEQLHELDPRRRRVRADEPVDGPLEARLRRAWDWITRSR